MFEFDHIANVYLSKYGERFSASICFDDSLLNPGDGFPLIIRLYIINCVDGSCPIEISLRWLRQVCTNGMTVLCKQDKLEQIHHLDRINPVAIRDFIATRVPKSIAAEKETFGRWLDLKIVDKAFKEWIQKDVRDAWGLHAAARLYHSGSTFVPYL